MELIFPSTSAIGAAAILLSVLLIAVWCFVRLTGRPATLSSCDVTCGSGDTPVIHGGRCLHLRQVQEAPAATIVEGLLTPDECAHMLNHVALAAAASGITQSDRTPQRTGTVLCLRHQSGDLVLAGMLSRLSKLLGVPTDRFEECQMVLYGNSERYSLHHDCLEPRRLSRLPSHQRVATVLVYLTDLPASCGGGTSFPRFNGLAGYEATPVAQHGQRAVWAVLFRLSCLLSARLAALGSSALLGRGRTSGHPPTASGARASRLQSLHFTAFDHPGGRQRSVLVECGRRRPAGATLGARGTARPRRGRS